MSAEPFVPIFAVGYSDNMRAKQLTSNKFADGCSGISPFNTSITLIQIERRPPRSDGSGWIAMLRL